MPENVVAELDYPVLFIQGTADRRVPLDHALRLKAAARDPASELWLVPGGEHPRAFKTQPDEYTERAAGYFNEGFRQGGPCSGVEGVGH